MQRHNDLRPIGKAFTSDIRATGNIFEECHQRRRESSFDLKPPFPGNCIVEVTNACNHACVFCANPRMRRKISRLPLLLFTRFIREAASLGLKEVGFYSTGEPLLVHNLHEFVRAATEAGVGYTYITTNGALASPDRIVPLIEAGLKSVKFSINAASPLTYRLVHGTDDFEKVLENVRFLASYRKTNGLNLRLLASCVLTRATEAEAELHRETFGGYFDDISYSDPHGQTGISLQEASAVVPSGRSIAFPASRTAQPCFMLWKRLHLTAEGYLTLCCVDYELSLTYADYGAGGGLAEHWLNPAITGMRRRHLGQDLEGTRCHGCLYGGGDSPEPLTGIGRSALSAAPDPRKLVDLRERIIAVRESRS